jgi:hypothetical protein
MTGDEWHDLGCYLATTAATVADQGVWKKSRKQVSENMLVYVFGSCVEDCFKEAAVLGNICFGVKGGLVCVEAMTKKERKKEIEENSICKVLEKRKRLFRALKYALDLRIREGRRGSTGNLTVKGADASDWTHVRYMPLCCCHRGFYT